MKYNKPEVTKLDEALSAIQHIGKTQQVAFDNPLQLNNAATANAYEADE